MKLFAQLILREFKMFSRNGVLLAVFLGAPLFFGILLGFVYQNATVQELPVLVVDFDDSPLSNNLIDALEDNEYLSIRKVLHSNESIRELMQQGIDNAVINIPKSFEGDIQQKRYPEIDVDINTANILTANYAARGIQHVLETYKAGIEIGTLNKKGIPVSLAKQQYESFRVNLTRFFNPGANYLEFLWPGVLAAILQQVYLLAMALTFSREYETGSFRQLTAQTRNPIVMMLVKTIPYWITGMLLWWLILRLVFPFFRLPMIGVDMTALFVLSALFILAVSFLGILVSVLIPSQLKSTEILMIIASPSFILSGFTWPLSQMPEWVQDLARTIPLTPYLSGFRKIFMLEGHWRAIQPEINNLLWITAIAGILSLLAVHLKIRQQLRIITVKSSGTAG